MPSSTTTAIRPDRLERHADLADNEHVQRRAKRAGNLGGDGNAPARQAKNDDS